jgi:2-methylcitrate dehydratase PrpD
MTAPPPKPSPMSLTRSLVRLIESKPLRAEDYTAAAEFVLDAIANAIAARTTPQGSIVRAWYGERTADTGRLALLCGALVHVLEMDDLHRESVTHPGCVVVPAAWAVAGPRGIGGRDFLRAVLAGYEAVCRVGNAVGPRHYKIWHNTATCGPFGSAVAAGTLLELREEPMVWALGNAGTQAAGLWQFLEEGAMSKHLHAGRAAEAGVVAAELAAHGFTGPARILEGGKGFFAAACPDADPTRVVAAPDAPWQLTLTSIKPWPSCRHTHPAIDAALELQPQVSPHDVAHVRIETYRAALDLCDNAVPSSEYEAKFSLHHCVAAALADGRVTLASFDGPARENLAPLRSRVAAAATAEFDSTYPNDWGARVSVRTTSGTVLVAERSACKGDPQQPLARAELRAKAERLLAHAGWTAPRAAALCEAILALADDGSLPDLEPLLR